MFQLNAENFSFPRAELALRDPDGLLAFGGDLHPERLIEAYRNGIFPWYTDDQPPLWWSPDPRTVFLPNHLHISRSMQRFIRKTDLTVTINAQFEQVIAACAEVHAERDATWIHQDMQTAYCHLHQIGHAHSIEVWQDHELVGGMYGVAVGDVFCGESMFHRVTNASKLALFTFAKAFFDAGGVCIDAQVPNAHTNSLGAQALPRAQFLRLIQRQVTRTTNVTQDFWKTRSLSL